MNRSALDYYASPGRFTELEDGVWSGTGVRDVVDVVQGLLVYDLLAEALYGAVLPVTQAEAIHERDAARLLSLALTVDSRPIDEERAPADRAGARCHQFTRLTVALLRASGVPARARCGFASYFVPGYLEDHWVAEVWDAATQEWKMVDAQLDAVWRDLIPFEVDRFAIGPAEFVTAGHAWQAWRQGELDEARCGLTSIDEHGAHWIAGNLRLDLAALNKVEMNPWDDWGERWDPGEQPTDAQLALFDAVAELTVDPDRHLDQLRQTYESEERLRMDGNVFSVLRDHVEQV